MINRRNKIPRDAELNKETIDYILDEKKDKRRIWQYIFLCR